MNLVMTLLVRDEEDILDWNLRYHLAMGVDHVIVTDNRSTDGTADILRRHERDGSVTVIVEPGDDFSQDIWVTRMAELATEQFATDWIIHSDADEFWWPEMAPDLESALAEVTADTKAIAVERHNFLGPAVDYGRPFFERMIHRDRRSTNSLGRSLPPKVAHRPLARPYVHPGNHAVSDGDELVDAESFGPLSIMHFPARSSVQLRAKIAKGGAAYERNSRFELGVGSTWRAMYEHLRAGTFEQVEAGQFTDRPGDRQRDLIEDTRLRDYLSLL